MPGQPSKNANNSLCGRRHPTLHTKILTPVQVPNNPKNCLRQVRLPTIPMQILTPVQAPGAPHAHTYSFKGSQHFRPFLTPGKPPNNSKHFLHD
ncbi:hypothetical protein O181_030550 [Austropuccinia psidii MF-1]|uniref:Uncharacterized protein n=1 Tax=Austropuccinia psidii MF-1 TaxID=1389203 RepID=A0A9Q3CXF2_9BASI|nr:hypothetical protein [Austropuccinia psidii MF-1]